MHFRSARTPFGALACSIDLHRPVPWQLANVHVTTATVKVPTAADCPTALSSFDMNAAKAMYVALFVEPCPAGCPVGVRGGVWKAGKAGEMGQGVCARGRGWGGVGGDPSLRTDRVSDWCVSTGWREGCV